MLPDGSAAPVAGTRVMSPAGRPGQAPAAESGRVPDVVAPPPRHPRFALIDGMRAIAVLSVVGVHAAVAGEALSSSVGGRAVAHLNIGVTIFFLISGFLLYRPFIAHRGAGAPAPRTADYAKRRFLRIYPAYWVALTVLVVVPGLTGVVDGNWLAMYSLGHTLPLYEGRTCTEATFECGLAHTWSLVIEVTFYAALPLWAYAVARLTDRVGARHWIRVELLALAAMSAVSVALGYVIFDPVPDWIDGSVVGYGYWFALGMGMAVASVALAGGEEPACGQASARRPARGPLAAGAGGLRGALWRSACHAVPVRPG